MDISTFISNSVGTIQFSDIIDIAIVAFLVYRILILVKDSSAGQVFKGIILIIIGSQLSSWLNLYVSHYILDGAISVGVIALVIVFQPELRKMLGSVGNSKVAGIFNLDKEDGSVDFARNISLIITACYELSATRTGALIVFERETKLGELSKTGTALNADVSKELLENIFYPKSPLHDGAAIIRSKSMRIVAAGCVLPLSENTNLSRDLGTRHRAGVGVSEKTDAVTVIVSEETGSVSCAVGGMLKRHLTRETLEKLLHNELEPPADTSKRKAFLNFFRSRKSEFTKR